MDTTATLFRRTSLRVLLARARPGDMVTESTLIGPEPDWPIPVDGLTFERCKFVRCRPSLKSATDQCRFDQRPRPADPEPEEMTLAPTAELAEILTAARDGRKHSVSEFARKCGLSLSARVAGKVFER